MTDKLDAGQIEDLRRDIFKAINQVLDRHSLSKAKAVQALRDAIFAFDKDEEVLLSKNCANAELRGTKGFVRKRLQKCLIVEAAGKQWRVPPSLISKIEAPRA